MMRGEYRLPALTTRRLRHEKAGLPPLTEKAQALTTRCRAKLAGLCESAVGDESIAAKPGRINGRASAVEGSGAQEV